MAAYFLSRFMQAVSDTLRPQPSPLPLHSLLISVLVIAAHLRSPTL
ncbi:hypothetical protein CCACVL1_18695 [Corchorus capsularis]|uniref:Uncharacterized protein n=1 Tax=Corchorus capsularis TaxID=210143 RepID=A0A1R3HK77_COCAP|nr:hypothetical protein CCACVL1_18695 [Corchorus capsularis]